jgi:hypothetical protein
MFPKVLQSLYVLAKVLPDMVTLSMGMVQVAQNMVNVSHGMIKAPPRHGKCPLLYGKFALDMVSVYQEIVQSPRTW